MRKQHNRLALPGWVMLGAGLLLWLAAQRASAPTWQNQGSDGGELAAAVLTGGVAHPPGYPLYLMLGSLALKLPGSTPFARLAWLSCLPAWLAALLMALWVRQVVLPRDAWGADLAGWSAGVLLVGGAAYAGQAVIVEVYGLQLLFVALALWAFLDGTRRSPRFPLWGWLALLGIGLGAHLTNALLLLPWLFWGGWVWRRGDRRILRPLLGGLLLAGLLALLLYLVYLPGRARHQSPVNWGNAVSPTGIWWLVSGQAYRGMLFGAPPAVFLQRLLAWVALLREQFGLVGLVLGAIGALNAELRRPGMQYGLLWLLVAYSLFAIGYYSIDSTTYLLPAYLAFAAWAGMGVAVLAPFRWQGWPLGKALSLAVLVWGLARLPTTATAIDPQRPPSAEAFAHQTLTTLPEGAILVTQRDQDTFPLWYHHFGLQERPDLAILVAPMINMDWYRQVLAYTYPSLALPDERLPEAPEALATALRARFSDRIVCFSHVSSLDPVKVEVQCP